MLMRKGLVVVSVMAIAIALLGPVADSSASEPVTVLIPFTADERTAFVAELDAFASVAGIEIVYEDYGGDPDLLEAIVTGDDPPDIVVVPRHPFLLAIADDVVPASDLIRRRSLQRFFGNYLTGLVSDGDDVLGIPIQNQIKSLVWYKPAVFEANGYTVPETFNQLVALSDRMVADGHTPWCNYIESGTATGWIGTDWMEDLVLSTSGPGVYDRWIAHDVMFSDPPIRAAMEGFAQMVDTPGYVFDRANMTNVFFFGNADVLDAESCLLHRQGHFFRGILAGGGADLAEYSTFHMPPVTRRFSDAVTAGGTAYAAALDDRRDVRRVMAFMASTRFGRSTLVDQPSWLMPHLGFDTSLYTDDLTEVWAHDTKRALRAGQFRIDASDQMPDDVGQGSFWIGVTEYVDGVKTIPEVLADIDASWPG